MHHVSRSGLYTSLEQRISYMHRFLEFDQNDINALIGAQKLVKEIIPMITDKVYAKLLSQDVTARIFHTHDSRVEEDPDEFLRPNDPRTQIRKMFIRWYLTKLNSDPTTMEYWRYLNKVGRLHIAQDKSNSVFVEYALLGTCMGYIQTIINDAVLNHPTLEMATKVATVKAVGKLIWIQNDLLARWHTEENREYQITVSSDAASLTPSINTTTSNTQPTSSSASSFVTNPGTEYSTAAADTPPMMKCPFSNGMAR